MRGRFREGTRTGEAGKDLASLCRSLFGDNEVPLHDVLEGDCGMSRTVVDKSAWYIRRDVEGSRIWHVKLDGSVPAADRGHKGREIRSNTFSFMH